MDGLGGFILGFFAGTLIAIISIALNITTSGTITIEPVKDDYKNEKYGFKETFSLYQLGVLKQQIEPPKLTVHPENVKI